MNAKIDFYGIILRFQAIVLRILKYQKKNLKCTVSKHIKKQEK